MGRREQVIGIDTTWRAMARSSRIGIKLRPAKAKLSPKRHPRARPEDRPGRAPCPTFDVLRGVE